MADNMESEEDLQELEVRLYSQVHHDAVDTDTAGPDPKDLEVAPQCNESEQNSISTGNVASKRNRYWAKNAKPEESQHKKFVKDNTQSQAETAASVASPPVDVNVSADLKTPEIGAIPAASGGGPEKERSTNMPLPDEGVARKKKNINPFSAANARKRLGAKDPLHINVPGNFNDRKMRKLELSKKMYQKRVKSRLVQMKSKKPPETIVLDSSDDEDVEIIPVPPPPVLTVDSSEDEEEKADITYSVAKPLDTEETNKQKEDIATSSRCNSPSSVVLDDFIGQQDKRRLLTEPAPPEDDDLRCTVGENNPSPAIQTENFATPTKSVSKTARRESVNYEVTQSNFRAIDVYESESSDMPESIYGKAKPGNLGITVEASDSDVEPVESVTKTKRLRKRKASGSNKGSEPNDDSTDSEEAHTTLPFISRGEAVENCKQKAKKRQLSNRDGINSVDREFMDKLSNIARGDGDPAMELDESHGSNISGEQDITARDIAENVLKQNEENAEAANEETAIPNEALPDLELFNVIDSLNTSLEEDAGAKQIGRQPTPELFFEDLMKSDSSSEITIIEAGKPKVSSPPLVAEDNVDNKFDFMNVVYTNRDHVAWTEEMVRFYDFSWGQEKFSVDRTLKNMNRNANWRISVADRYPKVKKFSNLKCHNCLEFGHHKRNCPLPRKDSICYICGDTGHMEPRCPNTICLRCGRKANVFTRSCKSCIAENGMICPICRIRGHSIDLCPDKWRRYHSTTNPNDHPNSQVFYSERKVCCVCARVGHLAENCKSSNQLNEYHIPTSEIRYHAKTYGDIDMKGMLHGGVNGIHLMCEPNEEITFPFSKKVSKNQYYGRFLDAVDLYDDPSSKIIRNYVLNPFAAKCEKADNKTKRKSRKEKDRKEHVKKEGDEDIQLNISGFIGEENKDNVEGNADDTKTNPEKAECKPDDENNTIIGKEEPDDEETSAAGAKLISQDETMESAAVVGDTDSNYSFSEHFPSGNQEEDRTSTLNINRWKSVGPLPDYIPFSSDSQPKPAKNKERTVGPLPDFISINMSDQDEEEAEGGTSDVELMKEFEAKTVEESCEGKIYLSKFHSQFLLSPVGTKFLIEISKKHSIKTAMDWTSVGNVLIVHGLPSNQDIFHSELMEKIKTISDEKNRKTLEQSQKMPRTREAIIKLLEDSLQQLEKTQGDVTEIHKKMLYNENLISKSSFKSAEKNRRLLNMILMGQAGLREGQMHLSILQDKLRELKASDDPVSDKLREELENHYRYIFTSYKHNNYDQLVRQYIALKKCEKLPNLELDNRLIGKKVLDTEFTKDQKELLMQPPPPPKITPDIVEDVGMSPLKTVKPEFGESPRKQAQNTFMPAQTHNQNTYQQVGRQNPNQQSRRQNTNRQFQNTFQQGQRQNPQHQRQQRQQQNSRQQQHPRQQQQYNQRPPNKQGNQRFNKKNQFQPHQRFNHQNMTPDQQGFQKPMQNAPRRQQQQHQQRQSFTNPGNSNAGGGTFVANQMREINKNWNNRTDNFLNKVGGPPGTKMDAKGKSGSCFWSRECMKFIGKSLGIRDLQPQVQERLNELTIRASKNMLSMVDYKAVKQIFYNLQKPGDRSSR